jgi:hypothetical protein
MQDHYTVVYYEEGGFFAKGEDIGKLGLVLRVSLVVPWWCFTHTDSHLQNPLESLRLPPPSAAGVEQPLSINIALVLQSPDRDWCARLKPFLLFV